MNITRRFAAASIAVTLLAALGGLVSIRAQAPNTDSARLEMLPVQGNVYMLAGDGGNISVQIGKEGVLLVDTGLAALSQRMLAEVQKLSRGPIRWIINTHLHPDHVGGNEAIAALPPDPLQPLRIVGQENVFNRLTSTAALAQGPTVQRGLPSDTYFTPIKDVHFNGEAVVAHHEPHAHTDGDTVVLFRGSDVVSTGDIFTPGGYPLIDVDNGGSVQGEIDALNHILDLTVAGRNQEGGTYVIPGHGRISDEADVVEFRDMVVIVRDRIQDLIKKRMTLEQIKGARLTRDYDGEHISPSSVLTADRFVEAMYRDLMAKSAPITKAPATTGRGTAPAGRK